jgi:hypothetical protein
MDTIMQSHFYGQVNKMNERCDHECVCFSYLGTIESVDDEPCVSNLCKNNTRLYPILSQKYDSSIYYIGESEIDAGANAISNMFKMGGLNPDQVTELNAALDQFKMASNHPIYYTLKSDNIGLLLCDKLLKEILDEIVKQDWDPESQSIENVIKKIKFLHEQIKEYKYDSKKEMDLLAQVYLCRYL